MTEEPQVPGRKGRCRVRVFPRPSKANLTSTELAQEIYSWIQNNIEEHKQEEDTAEEKGEAGR